MLTGVPHYFSADYIAAYEDAARADPLALHRAAALLGAIAGSSPQDSAVWSGARGQADGELAGRGLKKKPEDPQILETLRSGKIAMPLWGVSLDRRVAAGYGRRFLFLVEGRFHGVAAWRASGIEETEQEIITGGEYAVLSDVPMELHEDQELTVVLREIGTIRPPGAAP